LNDFHTQKYRLQKQAITGKLMIFKIVILSLLLVVLISLGSALVAMARGDKSDKMLKSLTWRIGLSVAIFILLLIGQAMGIITPHGLS